MPRARVAAPCGSGFALDDQAAWKVCFTQAVTAKFMGSAAKKDPWEARFFDGAPHPWDLTPNGLLR